MRGNSYLCSLAFGHLMVTIFVLPASVVSIMAGIEDKPDEQDHFCHFQWLITLICLIVSVLSFMFMSIDNYFGLGSIVTYELCCTKLKITFILLLIWICSIGFSLGQHFNDFGPEFCLQRRNLKIMINYHPYILGNDNDNDDYHQHYIFYHQNYIFYHQNYAFYHQHYIFYHQH